jgi:hypothetical protein
MGTRYIVWVNKPTSAERVRWHIGPMSHSSQTDGHRLDENLASAAGVAMVGWLYGIARAVLAAVSWIAG